MDGGSQMLLAARWSCRYLPSSPGTGILVTVPDDAFLADWCDRYLGARPACVLFRSGHLSKVVAAELADGRQVVIKAHPSDPRIAGCTAVQKHLTSVGFPCPEPLTAPVEARGLTVTAETLIAGGSQQRSVRTVRQRLMSTAVTFAALTESWSAVTATCAVAAPGTAR
jgi:hypothetical protein